MKLKDKCEFCGGDATTVYIKKKESEEVMKQPLEKRDWSKTWVLVCDECWETKGRDDPRRLKVFDQSRRDPRD